MIIEYTKDGDFFISNWLRNRNTLEYIGAWESLNNPDFNYGEFAIIKEKSGLNNFKVSVKEWVEKTINHIYNIFAIGYVLGWNDCVKSQEEEQ